MEPRNNAGPKDWQNMFAITRFSYIDGYFSNVLLLLGLKRKDSSLYQRLRWYKVSLYRGSTVDETYIGGEKFAVKIYSNN